MIGVFIRRINCTSQQVVLDSIWQYCGGRGKLRESSNSSWTHDYFNRISWKYSLKFFKSQPRVLVKGKWWRRDRTHRQKLVFQRWLHAFSLWKSCKSNQPFMLALLLHTLWHQLLQKRDAAWFVVRHEIGVGCYKHVKFTYFLVCDRERE